MKKNWIGSALAVVLLATIVFWPTMASGGAFVINMSDENNTCEGAVGPNEYYGTGVQVVVTPSGIASFACNVSLVSGPGVTKGTISQGPGPFGTSCHIVETPAGSAHISCH